MRNINYNAKIAQRAIANRPLSAPKKISEAYHFCVALCPLRVDACRAQRDARIHLDPLMILRCVNFAKRQ